MLLYLSNHSLKPQVYIKVCAAVLTPLWLPSDLTLAIKSCQLGGVDRGTEHLIQA